MRENEVICREPQIVRLDDTQVIPQGSPTGAVEAPCPQKKNRLSLFWKISGGTILSVIGFVAMLLFEQYNNSLAELRNDLKHFNETSAEFVKKDSQRRFMERMRECFQEMEASKAARTDLERELRASEHSREELAHEVQHLRERLANVEGRQAATVILAPEQKMNLH
jgi:hypothetical protein